MSVGGGNGGPAGPDGYGGPGPNGQGAPGRGGAGPPGAPYGPDLEPERLTLRDYLSIIWRRKWVVLIVVVVATFSAFYFSVRQTKMYQASATMFYREQIDLSNPLTGSGTNSLNLDREMATISDVMAGPDVQARAEAILRQKNVDTQAGYTITAEQQTSSTSSSASSASNVVVVTGDSSDPDLAAAAANAYTAAYIQWDAEQYRDQIAKAIPVIQDQLAKYTGAAAKLSSDYILLRQRLQDLQILRETTNGSYRALTPASVPTAPYAPNPLRSAILGLGVGLFAGIGLAFLLEQFDTRIRRPEDIAKILRQPILGRIPRISHKLLGESSLVALRHPEGHVSEAFRLMRTNLEFMAVDNEIRSAVLTSAMQGDGKSVTVANLAVSMAAAGKKVVVVDGDLRRPRQAKIFGVENEVGLSTVIAGRHDLVEALVPVDVAAAQENASVADHAAWVSGPEALPRLYLLPSGPLPPNPGEMCASRRLEAIIDALAAEADLVLVDTPAMLAVGDTSALAARVDGLIFLVDVETVRRPALVTAADQLMRLPTKMLGVMLRTHSGRGRGYYYYSPYSHYYGYTYSEDGRRTRDRRHRRAGGQESPDRVPATVAVAAAAAAPQAAPAAAPPAYAPPPAPEEPVLAPGLDLFASRDAVSGTAAPAEAPLAAPAAGPAPQASAGQGSQVSLAPLEWSTPEVSPVRVPAEGQPAAEGQHAPESLRAPGAGQPDPSG